MPHRDALGDLAICASANDQARGRCMTSITTKEAAEWGSATLVLVSGGMAGHYASLGMTPLQWAGAAVAVLGSVSVAIAVRVWPTPEKAAAGQHD